MGHYINIDTMLMSFMNVPFVCPPTRLPGTWNEGQWTALVIKQAQTHVSTVVGIALIWSGHPEYLKLKQSL